MNEDGSASAFMTMSNIISYIIASMVILANTESAYSRERRVAEVL